jgi:wyosine [tRNA(Phe)-imidazoG37] synthetase (radical SAM superfamily)
VKQLRQAQEKIDYLTFVPEGEPTLDANLGQEIDLLRPLGINIAVISNASLIWRKDVRDDLAKADCVSLKVDAVREPAWHSINRPHGHLRLPDILDGILTFASAYQGRLITETMLLAAMNDDEEDLQAIASFLSHVQPSAAYLSVPTRPPAEPWVHQPDQCSVERAYAMLRGAGVAAELLTSYEGTDVGGVSNIEEDLLSVTAVHPLREEAVQDLLTRSGADWSVVVDLVKRRKLTETIYDGHRFYTPERTEQPAP